MTRLTLLALLAGQPMHGYELRRQIELRTMDQWADIRYGSIYPALRRLADEGLVEEAGRDRAGNLPTRTTYRITDAGREELKQQAVGHLPSLDAIVADVFDHNRRVVAAELAWAAHVLERVRAGAYLETDPEGTVEDGS